MFKKQHLALAIAATLAAGAAHAELETSVVLKNETARFLKDGIRTGEATSTTDTTGEGKATYKFENTAKIFLNDEFENGGSWHGELNIVRDTKAINDYKGHENYTQRDWLRELYMDTTAGDWDLRLGKQQVVWGTADGIKLLDMINPTDWSEFNQNAPADARIPVWMVNAEKYLENGGNIQVIVSEAKKNKIAGLNASGDSGHPFIMKGVDSITGQVNGFLNVAPNLAGAASTFDFAASNGGFATSPTTQSASLATFTSLTVDGFAANTVAATGGYDASTGMILAANQTNNAGGGVAYSAANATDGINLLVGMAENGTTGFTGTANNGETNLVNTTWDISTPDSAFEYMPMATFATFNSLAGMTTRYDAAKADESDANFGMRFKNTTNTGLNYSFNYAYRKDSNPFIDLSYRDRSSGEKLTAEYVQGGSATTGLPVTGGTVSGTVITADQIPSAITSRTQAEAATISQGMGAGNTMVPFLAGAATNAVTVMLKDSSGNYYGARNWDGTATANTNNDVELLFEEKLNRVHNIGGSFDFSVETDANPVVIRGEWLYTKDEMTPVVDKRVLAIGDLAGALKMEKTDTFKYVIGADVTVATDLFLSGQFIQFRNLDYVDTSRTCTSQMGTSFDCSKYTADMATLSMSNQLQKGEENKNFYSVYLSKPFGESGEGRWNNIFIYEENGGKWNRFDVEYGFDDQLIGTFEVNKYFGDNDTMFGQFGNNSNVQIGVKYLLQ